MSTLWNALLFAPLLNALILLYRFFGNLGVSIILLTIILRLLMTPLVIPSLKITKKLQEIAPELEKLKAQYKDDKQGFVIAQAQLYKEHGANPASGCLPQIVQLLVLIALFSAFNTILRPNGESVIKHLNTYMYSFNQLPADTKISNSFLYLDLSKPDIFRLPNIPFPLPGIFLLLSAVFQFLSSKMLTPIIDKEKQLAKQTEKKSDDTMVEVQQQMLYLFPLMTLLIGYQFPSGLVIYWLIFSLASVVQQYFISGWGGLQPWIKRLYVR